MEINTDSAACPGVTARGSRQTYRAGLFIVLVASIVSAAWAHRGHAVWTDVSWNGTAFEITHRLHVADALTVHRSLRLSNALDAPESLAALALYAERRFQPALNQGTGQGVPSHGYSAMNTLGAEIEDDFLLIYQEWPIPLSGAFPDINNTILTDVEHGVQHFMRITGPGIDEERGPKPEPR